METLNFFVEATEIMALEESNEWTEIMFIVDSGAGTIVMRMEMIPECVLEHSDDSRKGVMYEVANDIKIPARGQNTFVVNTPTGAQRRVCAQIADVNKALLSVSQMCEREHRVIFDSAGSFIQDKQTGKLIPFEKRGSTYSLRCLIRKDGSGGLRPVFTGQR